MNNKIEEETPHKISSKIFLLRSMLSKLIKDEGDFNEIHSLEKRIDKLKIKLDKLSHGVSVSDHALVRYLDRGMTINVEGVREHILKSIIPLHIGDGKYFIGDGLYAVVRGGVVATILNDGANYKVGIEKGLK